MERPFPSPWPLALALKRAPPRPAEGWMKRPTRPTRAEPPSPAAHAAPDSRRLRAPTRCHCVRGRLRDPAAPPLRCAYSSGKSAVRRQVPWHRAPQTSGCAPFPSCWYVPPPGTPRRRGPPSPP
eukprot:scaffold17768_cov31-Tisochrysis_lutea.AAC.2